MRHKLVIPFLVLLPFFALSQTSSGWSLFVNKTKLLSSSLDSVASVQLPKESHGNFRISFAKNDTSVKRTVLLMNKQRQTFLQKEMKPGCKTASFSMANLLSLSKAQAFTIYIADIPADPAKAMLVRIAPRAICEVEWK